MQKFSSVQLLSCIWLPATPWTAAHQASCPSPNPKVYSNSCPLSRWCHPTVSPSVVPCSSYFQSFPQSGSFQMSQFFTLGGQSVGSFSFSISPSNEYLELISFRMDWFDLLAVPGILKRLLQHHSSKASILQHSTFFLVQLSHPYMITGKIRRPGFNPWVGKIPWRRAWQPTPLFLPGESPWTGGLQSMESQRVGHDWVTKQMQRRERRRKWQPSPVSLPEKSHGTRSLAGYSPWGCQIVGHNLATKQQKKNKTGLYIYNSLSTDWLNKYLLIIYHVSGILLGVERKCKCFKMS